MAKFYLRALWDTPSAFRESLEAWQFWLALAGGVILAVSPEIVDHLSSAAVAVPGWVRTVPVVALVLYCFGKAIHRRFAALEDENAALRGHGERQAVIDGLAMQRATAMGLIQRAVGVGDGEISREDWFFVADAWETAADKYLETQCGTADQLAFRYPSPQPGFMVRVGDMEVAQAKVRIQWKADVLQRIIDRLQGAHGSPSEVALVKLNA